MSEIKIYQYQHNNVTFQLDNGDVMVNLTEMAKPFGKLPANFLNTEQTKRFIEALEETVIDIPITEIKQGGSTQGTWAHQKLALKFAGWLDPRFELWIYDRIEELLKSGYTKLDSISVKDLAKMLLSSEEEKDRLLEITEVQAKTIEEQSPRVLFAQSVETSRRSILVAELAKLLTQNGVEIGQNRLFAWLRDHGYLGNRGEYYNIPSQMAMEMGLFELKKTSINKPDGSILVSTTPKVTGKGQVYFVNKFLKQLQPA
ncbi:MAG: phage antirepressor KilAC domain-containing protein [Bacteroidetes bacterium]|nr:phage antirepressor KilAC domain-containing protein [Bacteroidota bacterium]